MERYKDPKQRKAVCGELLEKVEMGLRGVRKIFRGILLLCNSNQSIFFLIKVTLNVPTYEDRQVTYIIRSLYQPASVQ